MKQLYFLVTLLLSTSLFSQKIITEKINSTEFAKGRTVKIYIPKNYDKDETVSYPVAIVLGDQYLFDLYVGNAKLYADTDKAPRQIVVGIDMRETYTKDVAIIPSNNALTNSAKKFQNFIKKELIPHMEINYRTSPFMTIASEGKGADFITYFLKDAEPIFNSFICITPRFTEFSASRIESYSLSRLGSIDNSYFLYTSNNKKYITAKQNDRFSQLGTFLSSFNAENIHITFDKFTNAPNHLSVIGETIPRAFEKMFYLYAKITKSEFDKNIKDLGPLEAIKYVEKKYLDIQYLYGSNLNVRLDDIFAIEGIVIDKLDGDYLRVLGDFVMIKYPDSHIGDFYVGKYYEKGKDYEKAEFYYKAAYGKMEPSDPNANAFYENIKRATSLKESQPKEEIIEDLPEEDDNEEEKEDDK
ncbi:alpha/beta hydrolase-fold protein [Tenacibaculum retecalamus]|uniref:alpha/beta hydrolase-fold protein n=1 Tax=Tenacibaculum retecalamus TaxID=3018315 RepID=UPI0023D93800|nr:alpha/beta hydrolase-fold protein [Tenacibaculum retecalamus]WBX70590.1 alpha/beta hydrolase-fold protein [Tenacibaculum retecalamus]